MKFNYFRSQSPMFIVEGRMLSPVGTAGVGAGAGAELNTEEMVSCGGA